MQITYINYYYSHKCSFEYCACVKYHTILAFQCNIYRPTLIQIRVVFIDGFLNNSIFTSEAHCFLLFSYKKSWHFVQFAFRKSHFFYIELNHISLMFYFFQDATKLLQLLKGYVFTFPITFFQHMTGLANCFYNFYIMHKQVLKTLYYFFPM